MSYFIGGTIVAGFATFWVIKWALHRLVIPDQVPPTGRDRPDVAEMCQKAETDDEMRMRVAEACLKSGKVMIGNMKPDGSWEVKEMDTPKL